MIRPSEWNEISEQYNGFNFVQFRLTSFVKKGLKIGKRINRISINCTTKKCFIKIFPVIYFQFPPNWTDPVAYSVCLINSLALLSAARFIGNVINIWLVPFVEGQYRDDESIVMFPSLEWKIRTQQNAEAGNVQKFREAYEMNKLLRIK